MTSVKGQLLVMLETVAKALGDDLRGRLSANAQAEQLAGRETG
jgi:hypothetical protein